MAGYNPVNTPLALLLITIAIMAVTACLQPPTLALRTATTFYSAIRWKVRPK